VTANGKFTVEQRSQTYEAHIAYIVGHLFTLLVVQAYNMNLKLPTLAHQLHYLASRTWFFDAVTFYRKISVLLKLNNFNFAEFISQLPPSKYVDTSPDFKTNTEVLGTLDLTQYLYIL